MTELYTVVLVIASIALATITSARISYVLSKRWRFNTDPTIFFGIFTAGTSAVAMGFISYGAIMLGGIMGGLICAVATVPFVGVCWLFIVGANKAIERIIASLLNKVS